MRLAHLLLTHANPGQCERLINRLVCEDADIYIHVDLKTDIAPFLRLKNMENIYFINNRVKVNWAGYTIVQATVNGLTEILASGKEYSHINLLSGQDYPLKSTAYIHNYFSERKGQIFMRTLSVENEWPEAIPRIRDYHLPDSDFPGKYLVVKAINAVLPKRRVPLGLIPVGKSQWFTITPICASHIIEYLEQNPAVARFFKHSWAPDEMIFQTILYNSPHKDAMVNDNLVYTDWSAGGASPKVLTMDDADKLISSDKLFARKFSPLADSEILDYLDKHI